MTEMHKLLLSFALVVGLNPAIAASGQLNNERSATRDIVQKDKADRCPSGYRINGGYCEAVRPGSQAIKKEGACPSGYRISGTYCVKNPQR